MIQQLQGTEGVGSRNQGIGHKEGWVGRQRKQLQGIERLGRSWSGIGYGQVGVKVWVMWQLGWEDLFGATEDSCLLKDRAGIGNMKQLHKHDGSLYCFSSSQRMTEYHYYLPNVLFSPICNIGHITTILLCLFFILDTIVVSTIVHFHRNSH